MSDGNLCISHAKCIISPWSNSLISDHNVSWASRLEEKLQNMESENQVLRQQTLVLSPTKGLGSRFKTTVFQVMFCSVTALADECDFARHCYF